MKKVTELTLKTDSPWASDPTWVDMLKRLVDDDLEFVKAQLGTKYDLTYKQEEEARVAFLRFIALTVRHGGGVVPIPLADKFWHEFILFTAEYSAFCERHFGRFIHHQPRRHYEDSAGMTLKTSIELLGLHFGNTDHLLRRYCS